MTAWRAHHDIVAGTGTFSRDPMGPTEAVPTRTLAGGIAMAMVTDPVCGMNIDDEEAAATATHEGMTYYFCSQVCHDAFVANPGAFLA